jgi:hypothetical protein
MFRPILKRCNPDVLDARRYIIAFLALFRKTAVYRILFMKCFKSWSHRSLHTNTTVLHKYIIILIDTNIYSSVFLVIMFIIMLSIMIIIIPNKDDLICM